MGGSSREESLSASALEGARNVLLLVPSLDIRDDEGCVNLLTLHDPSEVHVLFVTFADPPGDRVSTWRSYVDDEMPAEMAVVASEEASTSAASRSSIPPEVSVETFAGAGDLSGLGLALTRHLSEWEGSRIAVCIHSVTDLLGRAGLETTFRLLHVLTHHVESTGAVAHCHMDPGAHDQQTINTLKTLFDAAVGLDEDGEWTVSKR